MDIFKTLLDMVFVKTCYCCGEIIEDDYFCDYCFSHFERIDLSKFCNKCGYEKKNCHCKSKVFYFDGIIAPFINDGDIKRVMHKYKFRNSPMYAEFYANEMSIAIKQGYFDIEFDFITSVPMDKFSKLRRGYNQSEILAEEISKRINIPHFQGILKAKKKKHTQHKLSYEKRFDNVKEIYYTDCNINGKTVLLVDDIKTSGATLSECAKQLLKAGANRVYCVTALITDSKKGKKNGN